MPLAIAMRLDILLFSLVKIEQASQGMQGMDKKLHIEGTKLIDDKS
ncbi:hypothetical protein F170042I7_09810 [Blautia caecimuris]